MNRPPLLRCPQDVGRSRFARYAGFILPCRLVFDCIVLVCRCGFVFLDAVCPFS